MKIDLSGKLDLSEIDLTAPDKVVEEILAQLPEETNKIVLGKITPYKGEIESYTTDSLSGAISAALATRSVEVDIQEDLGESGKASKRFECYIYTPVYEHYKYRVFFMEYGIANYPVKLVIEESVARSIFPESKGYIYICKNKQELERILVAIFTSKKMISVMQEIIWIYQAKKTESAKPAENEEINGEE